MAGIFRLAVQEKMTEVEVHRFGNTCDAAANEFQYPVLAARRVEEPLYEVHIRHDQVEIDLWFFAYIDGGFRYVGRLAVRPNYAFRSSDPSGNPKPTPAAQESPKKVPQVGVVKQAELIHREPPEYPW
ncbi:MAG: hypothetical protein ACHQKY_18250, partial [Terriglobia bacterium]